MIPYRNYLVIVLAAILALNGLDSVTLGVVLQSIQQDLHASDKQLGFLTGFAFALFYTVIGVPIARWADRGDRVVVIATAAGIWSAMVTLCGTAKVFYQLLAVRIGVAIGEAGCMPAAQSLISDYFSRAERPRAFAVYMLGIPASALVGYVCAGWINQVYGWRVAFRVLAIPGVAFMLLCGFTLRDPRTSARRGASKNPVHPNSGVETGSERPEPTRYRYADVLKVLSRNATIRHMLLYSCVATFCGAGLLQWQPAFFIRSHGMQTGQLGTYFALTYGLGGFIGIYAGGRVASRYAGLNETLQFRTIAIAQACFGVISAVAYLCSNTYVALGLLALAYVGSTATYGPNFAVIQTLVPEGMRATALAVLNLCGNLIGLGLGPLTVGLLSDAFKPWAGSESLRYALIAMCPGFLWAGWHAWGVARTVRTQLAQCAHTQEDQPPALQGSSGCASEGRQTP